VRLPRVLSKIKQEMDLDSVICLQEVSHLWQGKFLELFSQHDYIYVHSAYGGSFNGYMGVGIAYPKNLYDMEKCHIQRIADTKSGGYTQNTTVAVHSIFETVFNWFKKTAGIQSTHEDPWTYSQKRSNNAVMLKLLSKQQKRSIWICTYHMPCAFFNPPVMTIHLSLLFKYATRLSGGDPLIIAGDFNVLPNSGFYSLATSGDFGSEEERRICAPSKPAFEGDSWSFKLDTPMQSAYAVVDGEEPNFTNFARTKTMNDGSFIETLDYLFFNSLKVKSVEKLPSREAFGNIQSFPTESEPSDHIKIAAEFEFLKN